VKHTTEMIVHDAELLNSDDPRAFQQALITTRAADNPIFSINRVKVAPSDTPCKSLAADDFIGSPYSATLSEDCDKLLEARVWPSLPLITISQIISIFGNIMPIASLTKSAIERSHAAALRRNEG
jgi:hypothetical protein